MADTIKDFASLGKALGFEGHEQKNDDQSYLPEDYVSHAEKIMKGLLRKDRWGNMVFDLTTSQLRNILSLINQLYNEVMLIDKEDLPDEIKSRLQYIKVRLLYESGRTRAVKEFVEKADLIKLIDGIKGKKSNLIKFVRFMEAMVAYHKYYGGN
ncbi:MAG: type III-A CRISPR-associated protein Csm2 [Clostridiales bacterium]|nr:type III-A CRISPR-associated protein Csm2 [Clostridiales bacterium]